MQSSGQLISERLLYGKCFHASLIPCSRRLIYLLWKAQHTHFYPHPKLLDRSLSKKQRYVAWEMETGRPQAYWSKQRAAVSRAGLG